MTTGTVSHGIAAARSLTLLPLGGPSLARDGDRVFRAPVGRRVTRSSAAVLGAGACLPTTALGATLTPDGGVSWVGIATIGAAFLVSLGLATLALPKRLRDHARVLFSKHLLERKYDYRDEWSKFTDTLARDPDDAPTAIVDALLAIVESESGALWGAGADGRQELLAVRGLASLGTIPSSELCSLVRFLGASGWLVHLDEFRAHPERYPGLTLPAAIVGNSTSWLIVPLPFDDDLVGFVLVARSALTRHIDWEDRDLLKTAGRQAAALLARRRAHAALTEARQSAASGKLSAYVLSDLRKVLGQQSLIIGDAARRRHEPELADDVIAVLERSVARMQSLLEQLRAERGDERREPLELAALVREAVTARAAYAPAPTARLPAEGLFVRANREKLVRVFGHLIQNAQEATSPAGKVEVALVRTHGNVRLRIADDGQGMSRGYVRKRLFKPFESTKGPVGMGIGAFESREYVRALGGNIVVASVPGEGTIFTVELPLAPVVLVADASRYASEVHA